MLLAQQDASAWIGLVGQLAWSVGLQTAKGALSLKSLARAPAAAAAAAAATGYAEGIKVSLPTTTQPYQPASTTA
jgi:hypothetical protein